MIEFATYIELWAEYHQPIIILRLTKSRKKSLYREKSINDARDEFHEPLQCDLIALARWVPGPY